MHHKIKNVLLFAFCILSFQINAQKKDKAPAADREINIYRNAMQYADYEAAKNAVFALIEKYPENNSYLDTLTRLYFYIGAYNQTVMAGNACLKKDTTNNDILEMVAVANSNLNRVQESFEMYKRLQNRTKSPYFAYQVAFNEYQLKRYEDCCITLEGVIKDTASDKQNISINMERNKSQRVPLKAAACNLLGVAQLDMNQIDKAVSSFNAALEIYPDFELAKINYGVANKAKESSPDLIPLQNPQPEGKK